MSFAQQGSVAIGVGSNLANVSWQNYALTPTVGYFITDNIMVGTGFSMGSSSEEDVYNHMQDEFGDQDLSSFSISPFFRYYMNDALFVSVGIATTSTSDESDLSETYGVPYTTEVSTSTFGLIAGVG